jgi:hypothetical protein
MSVLFLYLRIFGVMRWLRWTVWISVAILAIFVCIYTPIEAYHCSPKDGGPWNLETEKRCGSISIIGIPVSVISISFDIFIFVLPLAPVAKLNLPAQKKVGLTAVFATGAM